LTAVDLKRDFDMNTVTESVPTLEPVISPALRANAIRFLAMARSAPLEWLQIIRDNGGAIKETYGVPVEEIQEGIRHGVRKINIGTDIRLAMTGAIRRSLNKDKSEFDPRKPLKDAMQAAKSLCKERFEAFACAGQASRINPIHLDKFALRYRTGELAQAVR
jgi:Fructose/tagatose bisphosphate aldolase